ncbi:hypothetical protein GCK72_021405 [Caenorhabditis remanei]|uniref:Uncharacterized protein n=1 Tax=Caenorhabditis remanei TaxID=31234 RepID=A0A6A5GI19_CAERE|nr:hypothetical protein GCK72_021405 [Caenorhabditis remanei]KAF1754840.1 hypothetical protein GCK72_021405 [Caenorhabditis remanei]
MTDDSSLLRLPVVTKNRILYFCDYLEIARLRNVCHSLRNHIDLFKPDAHVKDVSVGNMENTVIIFESDNNSKIWIGYKEADDGCTVSCKTHMGSPPVTTISGLDPMDVLMQDFKIYLRHLKTPLTKLKLDEVCCNPLLQMMRSQTFKLKTNKLHLSELSSSQILAILPFFDAKCLKNLIIETGEALGVFQELFETEYWRNADQIRLYYFRIANVRQISHLKKFIGHISRATATDVEFLKNTFIRSPLFKRCTMEVDVDIDVLSIKEAFGAPSFDTMEGHSNRWHFHIPNDTTSVLLVEVFCKKILQINRINRSVVIPGAWIIH